MAGKLCDAAKLAADTAVLQLQPLHKLHVQGVAGGEGSEGPLDGAAGLAAIMQALQLAFSDLLGPLRKSPALLLPLCCSIWSLLG